MNKKTYANCFFNIIVVILFTSLSPVLINANNLQITNVHISEKNSLEHWALIQFDISVENSWRINTGATNWNAAWIFVKFRLNNGVWQHGTLSPVDAHHIATANLTIDAVTDGKGVFIYASQPNAGIIPQYNETGLQIRWNYGEDNILDIESSLEIKLYGIEMVYIPQGPFYIGSGGTDTCTFYRYPVKSNAFYINSESNPITVGTTNGNLYYDVSLNDYGGDRNGPISATFPKGYNGFYIMRYEISQIQYTEFLNSLTRIQQNTRTASDVSGDNINNNFVMSGTGSMTYRNGISCPRTGNGTINPIVFYCDYNQNGIGNENNDGQTIACGFLNWDDGIAYLDWAGLRPMTELEYEKACRGHVDQGTQLPLPVPNEYAWGTTTYTRISETLYNTGQNSEVTSNDGNGLSNFDDTQIGYGPLRCGFAATGTTNRIQSGLSYYGVSNMSDNLSERCITVGNSNGRGFTGLHGDGILDNSGNANVSDWPNYFGQSIRGGNFKRNKERMTVSYRTFATYHGDNLRYDRIGWRGVRTAE